VRLPTQRQRTASATYCGVRGTMFGRNSGSSRTQRPISRLSISCAALKVFPASRSVRAGSESTLHVYGLPFAQRFGALLVLPARLALAAPHALACRIAAFGIDAGRLQRRLTLTAEPTFDGNVGRRGMLIGREAVLVPAIKKLCRKPAVLILFVFALLLSGCTGTAPDPTKAPPHLASIAISPMTATIQTNQTQAYTASGVDQYGNPFAITPTFTATGSGSISGNVFTPSGVGTASVTAMANAISSPAASVTIVRVPPALQSINLSVAPASISIGGTATLTASGIDQYGNPFAITPTFSATGTAVTISGSTVTGAAQGSSFITAAQGGVTSNQVSVAVALDTQTVTFPSLASQAALTSELVTATASSGLPIIYSTSTPTICSVSGSSVSLLASGTCTLTATQSGNSQYGAASTTVNFTIVPAPQTITFSTMPSVPALSAISPAATASSNLPVAFTSQTLSVCSTTQVLTSGTCTIEADQAGNAVYAPAHPVTQSFTATLVSQTITFGTLPNHNVRDTYTLSATASSGLPVSFVSLTPSFCSVTTALTPGSCQLQASQAGNSAYAAATSVTQSFTIATISQTITFGPAPTGIQIGNPFSVTATSTSGLPVALASSTPLICSLTTAFTNGLCTIQATQAGNSTYSAATPVSLSFSIGVDSQTVTFPQPASQAALTSEALTATATSGLPVTYSSSTQPVCTVSGSTVSLLTAGTCTLTATQSGNSTYSAASATASFTVNLATQTITFPAPTPGQTFTVSATSDSGLPVTFSTTSTACAVSGNTVTEVSSGDCLIEADQAGNGTYAAVAPVTQDVTIGQQVTLISVTPSSITLDPGVTTTFTAAAFDQFNQPMLVPPTFTWINANPDGSVTATNTTDQLAIINITALVGGVISNPAILTVNPAPAVLTVVNISPTSSAINTPGGTQHYTITSQDQFGNNYPAPTCAYTSSNPSAATINTSGIAAAANTTTGILTTTITANCGSFTETATLNVNPPPFIKTITVNPVTLPAYSATLVPVSAFDEYGNPIVITGSITVGSFNSAIITVAPSTTVGMVSVGGVAVGQASVVLTVGGASTTLPVTVTACLPVVCYTPVLTTVNVTGETQSMEFNGTQAFTASGLDQHGAAFAGATYVWASNNTAILTVDANGNATAVGLGATAITASANGVTGSSLTITVGPAPYPTTPVITTTFPAFGVAKNYTTSTQEGLIPHSTFIVINGTGFLTGATVCFGSDCTPTQTTFKSSTKLFVAVPPGDLQSLGTVNITVQNPVLPGYTSIGQTSNGVQFPVTNKGFVTISFDDGFQSGYTRGTPIFNGMTPSILTTQFIITGDDCASRGAAACGGSLLRTDGHPWGCLFNTDANGTPSPSPETGPCGQIGVGETDYLTWANVAALAAAGNEIAPHTRSHNYLSYLTPSDRTGELQGSYNDLMYHAGAGVDTVNGYKVSTVTAYPYGDYGCYVNDPDFNTCVTGRYTAQQVGTDVKSAGYRGARSSDESLEGGLKYNELDCADDSCWNWADLPLYMHTIAGGHADGNTCTFAGGTSCDYSDSGAAYDPNQASCANGEPGFQCWVDSAVNNGQWVVFLFHRVDDNTASDKSLSVNSSELQLLANYLHAQGITVVTFGHGLAVEGIDGQYETVNPSGQVTVFPSPVD
jgi:hypothetical protein